MINNVVLGESTMTSSQLSEADSAAAQSRWDEYQASHDLSGRIGQTAGIDPDTGRIWFGRSIQDIVHQMDAEGAAVPLFFARIGSDTYWQKGGHH
jgi:hypothetical protein